MRVRYGFSIDLTTPSSVADPGFPRGGGAISKGGSEELLFSHFPQKLHEIKIIWTPRVARVPGNPP